jgi:hypothetical protein
MSILIRLYVLPFNLKMMCRLHYICNSLHSEKPPLITCCTFIQNGQRSACGKQRPACGRQMNFVYTTQVKYD